MFLTIHAAAGAFIGEMAPNPLVAFAFGFLSHFPLDLFPHGDRAMTHRAKINGGRDVRRFILMTAADAAVGIIVLVSAFAFGRFEHPLLAFAGLLGGILPDLIVAIPEYALYVRRSTTSRLRWFYRLHTFNHNAIITRFDVPMRIGFVGQLLFLILLWKLW
ncbi:MAG: hypothetical protein V1723_01945 [Candidatus Uhrbacteria bacterium]